MSMGNYAVEAYGMVLNGLVDDDTLEELAANDSIESQFSFTGGAFPLDDRGCEKWSGETCYDSETIYYISTSRYPYLVGRLRGDSADSACREIVSRFEQVSGTEDGKGRTTHENFMLALYGLGFAPYMTIDDVVADIRESVDRIPELACVSGKIRENLCRIVGTYYG